METSASNLEATTSFLFILSTRLITQSILISFSEHLFLFFLRIEDLACLDNIIARLFPLFCLQQQFTSKNRLFIFSCADSELTKPDTFFRLSRRSDDVLKHSFSSFHQFLRIQVRTFRKRGAKPFFQQNIYFAKMHFQEPVEILKNMQLKSPNTRRCRRQDKNLNIGKKH